MKGKVKRLGAVLLMGVMLLGGVLTAQAAEVQSSTHAHKVANTQTQVIRSVNTSHQFVNTNGETVTCYITIKDIQTKYVCSCGYVLSTSNSTQETHSNPSHK